MMRESHKGIVKATIEEYMSKCGSEQESNLTMITLLSKTLDMKSYGHEFPGSKLLLVPVLCPISDREISHENSCFKGMSVSFDLRNVLTQSIRM